MAKFARLRINCSTFEFLYLLSQSYEDNARANFKSHLSTAPKPLLSALPQSVFHPPASTLEPNDAPLKTPQKWIRGWSSKRYLNSKLQSCRFQKQGPFQSWSVLLESKFVPQALWPWIPSAWSHICNRPALTYSTSLFPSTWSQMTRAVPSHRWSLDEASCSLQQPSHFPF